MRIAFALAALLLLSACSFIAGSSPRTRYFILSELPGHSIAAGRIGTPISVAAVHIPASLDRQEMVLSTTANSVHISNVDRWAAPLAQMCRRVLAQDLAARLPAGMVVMPETPLPANTRQIVVSISQFGRQINGKAILNAEWSLIRSANGHPALRHDVHLAEHPSGRSGQAVAYAMSQLLSRLSGRIASKLSGH